MSLKKAVDNPIKNYIYLVLFVLVVTQMFPIAVNAIVNLGQAMVAAGIPFATFFTSQGIVGLLLGVGILFGTWKYLDKVGK